MGEEVPPLDWNSRKYQIIMRWKISRWKRGICRRILLWTTYISKAFQRTKTYAAARPKLVLGILAGAVVFILTATVFGTYLWLSLRPLPPGEPRDVTIPYASSAKGIANQLQAQGVIRSARGFVWYIRLFKRDAGLRAGVYQLKPGLDIKDLINQLRKGSPLIYRITIPEGYSLREVAALLASRGLVASERFIQLAQDPLFLTQYIDGFGRVRSAEGFLFPDTYEFAHGATEEEILAVFLRRFQEVWNEELPQRTGKRGLYDVLTMASIIEREAKVAEERPVIAGVFYNRLERGIPLESCATVQYALGKHKARLYYKDLQVKSDYNTYRKRGLPPGPICSPGRDAIRAALAPARHSYLYFVAKPDGKHHFSSSYREHLNARRILRQGRTP